MLSAIVVVLALVLGMILLAQLLDGPGSVPVRVGILALCATGVIAYLAWRVGHIPYIALRPGHEHWWHWTFAVAEFLSLVDFLLFLVLMTRRADRTAEADRHEAALKAMPAADLPAVDVFIATYNEEWEILERSIAGALALDYPHKKIWVLDDGKRAWLAEECRRLRVGYIARPDNAHKKAGNHNYALARTDAPFIAVFDADFVPAPNFLWRTLGFFADGKVGIVQTPQNFHNGDPMHRNLLLDRALPDDMRFFNDVIAPARDAWGAAFYIGSSAVLRRSALAAIGGVVGGFDTEDQVTSVALLAKGYVTRWLGESLSFGLAPESLPALFEQRKRWCRGSIQILFRKDGPLGFGLGIMHRLFFVQSYWLFGFLVPVVIHLAPLMFWVFGIRLFPYVDPMEVAVVPALLFAVIAATMTWLSRGVWIPVISQALHLVLSVRLLPTIVTSLVKPFGKPLLKTLQVTPKGAAARGQGPDLCAFLPIAGLLLATLAAMTWTLWMGDGRGFHPDEIAAAVIWTFVMSIHLTIAALAAMEPFPGRREEESGRAAWLEIGGERHTGILGRFSLSEATMTVAGSMPLRPGLGRLSVEGVGSWPVTIGAANDDRAIELRYAGLTDAVRQALVDALVIAPSRAQLAVNPTMGVIAGALGRRFLRAA